MLPPVLGTAEANAWTGGHDEREGGHGGCSKEEKNNKNKQFSPLLLGDIDFIPFFEEPLAFPFCS